VQKLDRIAIVLSGICLVHCLAIPLALVVLPTLGGLLFESHELFHAFLLVLGMPISVVALVFGYRRHGHGNIVAVGTAGLCLMLLGIMHLFGDAGEVAATVAGALVLTAAHVMNMRKSLHH
jgi:hypothetical protein|tara:strand:- start:1562 stop:1924 length:363 start_codon:yes stop_codon:yes gene_type:complete